jgi:large subunit ribosomal protein L15
MSRKEYKAINVSTLQALSEKLGTTTLTFNTFVEAGLVSKNHLVKILGNGELTIKIDVTAHAFSKKAVELIEALQGTVTQIDEKSKNKNQ